MSLRHDQKASRKASRAARRNTTALKRACEPVVSRPFERLEDRVLMALVHAYPFNEGTGTTTADTAGTKPGTLITDTDATAGVHGTAGLAAGPDDPGVLWGTTGPSPSGGTYLHFNGAPGANTDSFLGIGGRVDVAPDDTIAQSLHNELGKNGSVTAWIRITPQAGEYIGNDTMWRAPGITGNEQAGAGNDIFYGWITSDGRVGMQKGDAASAVSSGNVADGAWHHVAVTRNYDDGNARVYIDGRLQSSVGTAQGPVSAFWDSIGAITDVAGNGLNIDGYNYMNSTDMDDVRMFNHILSQGEILAMLPATFSGPLSPVTNLTAAIDGTDPRRVNLTFVDSNSNEAGFVIERALVNPDGTLGAFTQVGQTAAGTGGSFSEIAPIAFNQPIVYRVRAFNTTGDSTNVVSNAVQIVSVGDLHGVSAGYLNSNFWGALNRQWGTDPDLTDGATGGNAAAGVGSITLDPAVGARDPANPQGIAARDPDVRALFTGTADANQGNAQVFNINWGTGTPNAAIRADNHTTIHTGKLTFTLDADADADGTPNEDILIPFEVWSDDDGWAYVNGLLVSTDPGGHGQQAPGNSIPGVPAKEGQTFSWDVVVLQAEQGGGSGIGLKWNLPSEGVFNWIPIANLSPLPSRPEASPITVTGTTSSHQVTFAINDQSESEQRFELWRRRTSGTPEAQFSKVNETGINSRTIADASGVPGATYEYVLNGVNFASGYTYDMSNAAGIPAAAKVSVTFAAEPASAEGLQAFYYNDDFWGQGENRPQPRFGNLYVGGTGSLLSGGSAGNVGGADVHEFGVQPQIGYGDDNHDPAVRPGGSPHVDIRDNSHGTLWTGKITFAEPGSYQVLLFSDDDGYAIIDNTIVSSDPFGHGERDPRINPNNVDRFTNPFVTTVANETHDIVLFQSEQGGGSGLHLNWIRPGQTAVEAVPATALTTDTPAPTAAAGFTVTELRGTSALFTATDNASTNELKNVIVLATDAAFTQNVRRIPVGILVATGGPTNPKTLRITGLTPNTEYFAKTVALNMEGEVESTAQNFNSGGLAVPAAASAVAGRAISPDQIRVTWTDNSIDETGFLIRRRVGATGAFTDVDTVGPNTTAYIDTLPAGTAAGTPIFYEIVAQNAAGNAAAATNATGFPAGGAGGTGLRRRLWTNLNESLNNDNLQNNALGVVGEPSRNPDDGSAQAPLIDDVEGVIPNSFSGGAPDVNDRDIDTFAIEWVGEVQAEETKAYEFSIITDDGGRLFINGVEVIDGAWRDQGDTESFSEPINLTAGQKIQVRLQMYERGGGATARLRWNGPGNAREDVPVSFMFPTLGANDAVAQVPLRPVTFPEAFWLPETSGARSVAIRWQDNAFGEAGYEVQRATNAAFTEGLTTLQFDDGTGTLGNAGPGQDLVIDNDAALDPTKDYYYRVRPVGAPDTAWVNAGQAYANATFEAGRDLTLNSFANPEKLTLNNRASVTAEGTLKLTHNQNDRWASAYVNRAFDISGDFKVSYDQQIGNSNGADGMGFIIHNSTPATPAGIDAVPLRALGGGGGALGLAGITNSVAVIFDFHDALDTMGVYVNGAVPPGGGIAAHALRDNTVAGTVQDPNGDIDLRNAANNLAGVGALNIEDNTRWRVDLDYDVDTHVLTINLGRVNTTTGVVTPLNTSKWNVNIAENVGGNEAVMGWGAGTGGLNARQEVLRFAYDGPNPERLDSVPISEVYVRGSAWSAAFKTYMEGQGLGDDVYGYRVDNKTGEQAILPWVNVNEIVLRYASAPSGAGIPTPGTVTLTGDRAGGNYTVTAVNQIDPQTFALVLDRPLGNLSTGGENGVRVNMVVPGGGAGGGNFSLVLNSLQGDVNHVGETTHSVVAADFSDVKNRFFRTTSQPGPAGPTQYTVFHDVDGSGGVLANDFSLVKARFFDSLQTTPFPVAAAFSATPIREEVLG
jgi:hypothetical protein